MELIKDFFFNLIFIVFVAIIAATITFVFCNLFGITNNSLKYICISVVLMGLITKYLIYRIMNPDFDKSIIIKNDYYSTKFEEKFNVVKPLIKKKYRFLRYGVFKTEMMKALVISVIYTINIFYISFLNSKYEILFLNTICILVYLIIHVVELRYLKKAEDIFKNQILSVFVKQVNEEYSYINPILEQDITNMRRKYLEIYHKLENKEKVLFKPKDMITNETTSFYTNLNAVTYKYGDERDCFDGLYVYSKLENNFERQLHVINKKIDNKNKYDINTDNEEFEKIYNTLCEDKQFAKRILDRKVTTYMVGFYNKYNIKFSCDIDRHFMNTRFYIRNLLIFNVFKTNQIKKQLFILYVINDFIEYTKDLIDTNY